MVERFRGARITSVVAVRSASDGTVRFQVTVDGADHSHFDAIGDVAAYLGAGSPAAKDPVTLVWTGEVDHTDVSTIEDAFASVVTGLAAGDQLVLDVSAVTFMDAAGLNLLMAWRGWAADHDVNFVLRSPSRQVRRLLDISRADQLFAVVA